MSLYITEYQRLARAADGPMVAAGQEPAVANQKLNIAGTPDTSAAFAAQTSFVMVHTTEPCHLAFGDAPMASTLAHRLGAGETRFYGVSAGQKLSVIAGV
jgi:hypothetical protein